MARCNLSHPDSPLHPHVWPPKTGPLYRAVILHGHACCECERFRPCVDQLGTFKKISQCWLARVGERGAAWTCTDCLSRER
jgi:hypothetical protein